MTPADLQNPERGSAPVEDPAVVAGKEAQEAAATFSAIAKTCRTSDDETSPEFVAADKRTTEADAAFADALVTSAAGALAKMREIVALDEDPDRRSPKYLGPRHFDTVLAFLERFTGAPSVVVDPAVAALAEYRVAKAADDAISNKDAEAETPEYQATGDRLYAARDAVYNAVPTSMAGMAAKVRYIVDYEERGNDLWVPFDEMAKSMLPFLEGAPAPAPKPDPVVALFAKWAIIRDEATALSAADPKGTDDEINERWENAISRCDAVEDQIMATPATTMRGVAIKIRLASHYVFGAGDLDKRYATPARDIDYVEATGGPLDADGSYVISALRDAERLAGV